MGSRPTDVPLGAHVSSIGVLYIEAVLRFVHLCR